MKPLTRLLAFTLAALLCGCGTFRPEKAEPEAPESAPAPRIVTGSARGADLEPVSGVGELVEPSQAESQPESVLPEAEAEGESPLLWDLSLLPYRAMLSPEEQVVYDEVYRNIVAMNNHFTLKNYAAANRIDSIVHAVYYDNPELFWIDASYRYGYTSDNRVTDLTIAFNTLAGNIEAAKASFDSAAQELIDQAQGLSSDVEKEKFVHDAIVANVDYHLGSAQNQSAYSALVTKRSVCAGYSRAFQYVMMKLGIPCYYCVGFAGEDHAWNIIALDGDFYNVDLSWDDPIGSAPGEIHYEYYNITDEQIEYDHRRDDLSVNLPPCTGKALSYNNAFSPDPPVREGGAPQDYHDLGYTDSDVVRSVDEYYDRSREALRDAGPGESTVSLLLENGRLRQQIFAAISNRGWFRGFVTPAAEDLDLNDYSAEIAVKYEELADGYVLLTQTVTLKAGASADAA